MEIWQAFVGLIESALVLFNDVLAGLGITYSFGFAIILFTLVIKLVTMPLTLQQLRSSKKMQELQPRMKELQKKYKGDREKMSKAQMEMYKEAGVNPLGGCLPMLIQLPIWFALYRALFNLANEGVLDQGFFWIPSLAQPTDLTWIWPLPPSVGWATAAAFLVLPILTVLSQIVVQKLMTPTSPDPQQASMNQMMLFMPFMFGFFALQVPQGLALYWVTSNLFSLGQQFFITGFPSLNLAPSTAKVSAKPAIEASAEAEGAKSTVTKRTKKDGRRRKKKKR